MKVTITINCDNPVFQKTKPWEAVGDILRQCANFAQTEYGPLKPMNMTLHDYDGNGVGIMSVRE